MRVFSRVILIVLDGLGIGAQPDAAHYGDADSDTLGHVANAVPLRIPTLRSLGFDRLKSLGKEVSKSHAWFVRSHDGIISRERFRDLVIGN